MSLTDSLETLGNTTPSLALIVSMIVGAGTIVAGVACRKNASGIEEDGKCKKLQYVGGAVLAMGVVLFYFAQEENLASVEGLWMVGLVAVSGYVLYKVNQ